MATCPSAGAQRRTDVKSRVLDFSCIISAKSVSLSRAATLSPLATLSCEAANLFGWQIGGASAALADVLLLMRILLAPALGPARVSYADRFLGWRRLLRYLIWLMPIAWLFGAWWLGGTFIICYARGVAISATILLGMLLFVGIVTAANQIGRRSVR